jgi:hypothetical protein
LLFAALGQDFRGLFRRCLDESQDEVRGLSALGRLAIS